jgi:hypothetical protein
LHPGVELGVAWYANPLASPTREGAFEARAVYVTVAGREFVVQDAGDTLSGQKTKAVSLPRKPLS